MNRLTRAILFKELKDLLRDKRTIVVSLLVPLLLVPLLFFVMGKSVHKMKTDAEDNTKIVLKDMGRSALGKALTEDRTIKLESAADGQDAVKNGRALLYVEIPENFDSTMAAGKTADLKIFYDNSSQKSSMALGKIQTLVRSVSDKVVAERLTQKGIDTKILEPVHVATDSFQKQEKAQSQMIFSMIIPMLVLLYSATGPFAAASDLGVGEKERGTLEPLLTTRAGRHCILTGKLLAITIMGGLTTICSMLGFFIAMSMPGELLGNAALGLGYGTIALIGLISIITTLFFGSLELGISMYARSFKEAQSYLMPFIILPLVAAYGTMFMDARNISTVYFHIPLVNVCLVVKELICGIGNYTHVGITIFWSVAYATVAVLITRHLFTKESVIFRS